MKKILFIINPVSGIGKQKKLEKIINKHLDKNKFNFDVRYTKYAGHATEITKKATRLYDAVIIAGGDGSVNEVAQSLINTNTALGIIPTGSGNGFARHLKLPLKPENAIDVINNFKMKTVDTGIVNNRKFVNIAGIGFDADMSYEFANINKRGFLGYAKVIFTSFNKIRGKYFKLKLNDEEIEGRFFIIAFSNGSQYGLNAVISPLSKLNDGIAEVIIIKHFPLFLAPFLALKLFTGKINKTKYCEIYKTTKIKIINDKTIFAHADGEPFVITRSAEIQLVPKSLKVITP